MNRIILALDVKDKAEALDTVDKFSGHIDIFKVGLELFTSAGPEVVRAIQDTGKQVFLDLKFHDIPNTMSGACLAATRLGVYMFNVHASAGADAMKRCAGDVAEFCLKHDLDRPKILAVTVLTSLSQDVLRNEFCIHHSLRTHVKNLAKAAMHSGLDGVVASGHEAGLIRNHCGKDFLIVTPGVRPTWAQADDQKRVMTPREAMREGSTFLVIGRSIMKQEDPIGALGRIQAEIETAA